MLGPEILAEIALLRSQFELILIENDYLRLELKEQKEINQKLSEFNKSLIIEIQNLKDKNNINSDNSSLPPSKDLYKKLKQRKKSDRKIGGQPGHKGSYRPLLAEAEVSNVVKCMPEKFCQCGGEIKLRRRKNPVRHQVFEMPKVEPIVTEYKQYRGECACCRTRFIGNLPEGVSKSILGPRAMAFIVQGSALYHLSKSQIKMMLKDSLGIEVCDATISNVEKKVSGYFDKMYEELSLKVKKAGHLYIDETGHKRCGKRGYAWFFVNEELVYVKVSMSRGKKVLSGVIGEDFVGKITSDRYAAYNMVDNSRRQVCWAHLLRDFRRFANSEHKEVSRIGTLLLQDTEKIFELLKNVKSEVIKKELFTVEMEGIKKRVEILLYEGSLKKEYKGFGGSCENIYKLKGALWNFLDDPKLEATNNLAERTVRPFVIKRKISFGTWSERGDKFLERMMSIIPMILKSGKNVLESCNALVPLRNFSKKIVYNRYEPEFCVISERIIFKFV
jgi:transposase